MTTTATTSLSQASTSTPKPQACPTFLPNYAHICTSSTNCGSRSQRLEIEEWGCEAVTNLTALLGEDENRYNDLAICHAIALTEVSSSKCFEGYQKIFQHDSASTKSPMKFGVYLPPCYGPGKPCQVVCGFAFKFFLGLISTRQDLIVKCGAQRHAAKFGLILVNPDTGPLFRMKMTIFISGLAPVSMSTPLKNHGKCTIKFLIPAS
ncbi:hypothetical protein Aperf_G00000009730 [Anoplocephala perfoliata]